MKSLMKTAAVAATLTAISACSTAGGLGSVLGSVLGTGTTSGQQLQASVRSVDTRNQQIALTQSNGSTVSVAYDANTKVVYQNRLYSVTNLESGDQVTA